jgi:DNA-binding SARP family transcriptional activator/predicted ATPase
MSKRNVLNIKLLGGIELSLGAVSVPLPQSKKTRALLAYLVVTARPHRRERLCSLLWDVTDDPRGALRWSLSKLRALVDGSDKQRIVADRETVGFNPLDVHVDLFAIRDQISKGIAQASTEELEKIAGEFDGEFLEGLDLPDLHDFHSWCIAEREQARTEQVAVLKELVARLASQPDAALIHSRALVQVDPLNESAWAGLVRLLALTDHRHEAEEQAEAGARLLKELGTRLSGELDEARRSLRNQSAPGLSLPVERRASTGELRETGPLKLAELVGRKAERDRLLSVLAETETRRRQSVVLMTGDPGVGRTRLLRELISEARKRGGTVMNGRTYEAERARPYVPWMDALRRVPVLAVGQTIGADLAVLLPNLPFDSAAEPSRDRLFGAVVELIAARAHSAPPVVLVLDDVQWCDEASAELLHYVIRMNRHRPIMVVLAARAGELADNAAMLRVLDSLRREGTLEEVVLGPLNKDETTKLIREVTTEVDADRVFEQSEGNPLLALELARAHCDEPDVPAKLTQLVRARVERVPAAAGDVLRWCAVIGYSFNVSRLAQLTSLDVDELASALETLERHVLLREAPDNGGQAGAYTFAHKLVREAVYSDLSQPRRQLMHRRVAQVLSDIEGQDETIALDIAHHAALGGDAGMAARACVAAGRRCLRLFANTEAAAFARRGMSYAEQLNEPERVQRMIELTHISFAARRPDSADEAARTIETLAERALDHGCAEHARLAFHMLSYLHWERGDWSDAEREALRAHQVSQFAGEKDQVIAMAEAARCLALLERDLEKAEAMILEASALSTRLDIKPAAIPDAQGMLRLHEGHLDEAAALFDQARARARAEGNRVDEFQALEHLLMVELQRDNYARARELSNELVSIGEKLREGSESSFARVLRATTRYSMGEDQAVYEMEKALDELRIADAKHRLAYALTRIANVDLRRGQADLARWRAEEALAVAQQLERPSEIVFAMVALTRAAAAMNDESALKLDLDQLRRQSMAGVSTHAQETAQTVLEELNSRAGTAKPR